MALEPMPEDWERCLAVVAHPDDLEYGCAAALAKWTSQGKSVVEVLATRGEAGIESMEPDEAARVRTLEQLASAAVVGADPVEFLAHRDGLLREGFDLRRDLARAIRRHRPEAVATISFRDGWYGAPPSWNHVDHRVLGVSLLDAVRDAANRWMFPELLAEGHEPWSGVRFVAVASSPLSRHFVDVTGHVDTAVASLRAHAAYLEALGPDFDPDAFLRGSMAGVGREAGVESAIAVELL
jgi:LmbE family N-acetylglucosaminyl deacetylase